MTLRVMHVNNKKHYQLYTCTIQPKYFSHSSCIKYSLMSHVCHVIINIICKSK